MLNLGYDVSEVIIKLSSFLKFSGDKKLLAHLLCVRTHIIPEPSSILHIIDVTENLALSAKFRTEKINAGSKINAGLK